MWTLGEGGGEERRGDEREEGERKRYSIPFSHITSWFSFYLAL